jgi:CRP-like cAMP-binding protein
LHEGAVLAPLLRRWGKRTKLTTDDREAILSLPFARQVFGKDQYIVREGQEARECAVLLRGFAFRQKSLRDGGRQILSFHVATEFVDLENVILARADHNVQSVSRSEVALIPREALHQLAASRPKIGAAMWIDTLIDSAIFREWVVNVGRRDSRGRLAHLLCEMVYRFREAELGKGDMFEFPLTQEQLADATGLTAVHTNRTLQALRKEGLIRLSAGSLTILDWEGLCDTAGFDPLYLQPTR